MFRNTLTRFCRRTMMQTFSLYCQESFNSRNFNRKPFVLCIQQKNSRKNGLNAHLYLYVLCVQFRNLRKTCMLIFKCNRRIPQTTRMYSDIVTVKQWAIYMKLIGREIILDIALCLYVCKWKLLETSVVFLIC